MAHEDTEPILAGPDLGAHRQRLARDPLLEWDGGRIAQHHASVHHAEGAAGVRRRLGDEELHPVAR